MKSIGLQVILINFPFSFEQITLKNFNVYSEVKCLIYESGNNERQNRSESDRSGSRDRDHTSCAVRRNGLMAVHSGSDGSRQNSSGSGSDGKEAEHHEVTGGSAREQVHAAR